MSIPPLAFQALGACDWLVVSESTAPPVVRLISCAGWAPLCMVEPEPVACTSLFPDKWVIGRLRYQVDISALVEAGELKAVSGFDAIAQNHDLSNVLSLIDMPGGSLGHT